MKRKILFASVLIVCLCLTMGFTALIPGLTTNGPQITPEQAKAIVREWEGNPNLVLPEPTLEWDTTDPFDIPQYVFVSNKYYEVDAEHGYVSLVIIDEPPHSASWSVSPLQAKEIAKQFCSQKYPSFDQINWDTTVRTEESPFAYYEVEFQGKMPNGAETLNSCVVAIHPDTGQVLTYSATIPASPPPQWEPNISRDEAIAIAVQAAGFAEVLEIPQENIRLVGGNGLLVWTLEKIDGILPDGQRKLAWVSINALDGSLVNLDYCRSASRFPLRGHIMVMDKLLKRSEGPLFRGDKCYVSLRLFRALGGKEEQIKTQAREILRENGKDFISIDSLKKLLTNVVENVYVDKEREAVYILMIGDLKGAEALLPASEVLGLQDKWYSPKEGKLSRDERLGRSVVKQKQVEEMLRRIRENLEREGLVASEREIKKEFPQPYISCGRGVRKVINEDVSRRSIPKVAPSKFLKIKLNR